MHTKERKESGSKTRNKDFSIKRLSRARSLHNFGSHIGCTGGHFVNSSMLARSATARNGGFFCLKFFSNDGGNYMEFFSSAIDTLQTLVDALGADLGVWGVVSLLEGDGSDKPGQSHRARST